jgi:hypothetical protein
MSCLMSVFNLVSSYFDYLRCSFEMLLALLDLFRSRKPNAIRILSFFARVSLSFVLSK